MKPHLFAMLAFVLPGGAFAQEAATLTVNESEAHGQYLATSDGRAVYAFTTDTQGAEGTEATVSCTSAECLAAWPLVTTEGDVSVEGEAQADMTGTMEGPEGQTVATYNGWPLYHFTRDVAAEEPQGHEIESFGGEWYLLAPDGTMVGHEG